MKHSALITGVTGQDGSYLAELLLQKGYRVYGVARRTSTPNTQRIEHLLDNKHFWLLAGDVTDAIRINELLQTYEPNEIYHLAAQSHVGTSYLNPTATINSIVDGTANVLESVKQFSGRYRAGVKVYVASSSEMFGNAGAGQVINLQTPMRPISPYSCGKLMGHHLARVYREAYVLPIYCGVLFNHESERRGHEFVSRKITRAVARIKHGSNERLRLGNMQSRRDWGYAADYVEAMWRLLQQDRYHEVIVATGQQHSVEDFCREAFAQVDLDYNDWVDGDTAEFRPLDVVDLLGDSQDAREKLGWQPTVDFKQLVKRMVLHDMREVEKQLAAERCVGSVDLRQQHAGQCVETDA